MAWALLGCADESDWFPGDRVWESEHFRYHSYDSDDSVCPEVLDTLEQHFERTREHLGFAWDDGAKVDYYKFPDADSYERSGGCGPGTIGCGGARRVRTSRRVHAHELVHSYFDADGVYAPPFLAEGIATAMSCEHARTAGVESWRELVGSTTEDNAWLWDQGAWFVGYLLQHLPRQQFLDWYDGTRASDSAERIAAAFESSYGFSLDSAWQEARKVAGERIACPLLEECSAPALPLDGTPVEVSQRCDGSNQFKTILVEEPLNLYLKQDGPWLNQLSSCTEMPELVSVLSLSYPPRPEVTMVHLAPGRYTLGVSSGEPDAIVRVEVHADVAGGLTSSCEEAMPRALTERELGERIRINVTVPGGNTGDVWFVRLHPGEGHWVSVQNGNAKLLTTQCLGCRGVCEPTLDRVALPLDEQGAVTLRVERLEADPTPSRVGIDWRPLARP